MSFICPNCNQVGISAWAKYLSSPVNPATCRNCKGHCCESISLNKYFKLVAILSFSISLIIFLLFKSITPFVLYIAFYILISLFALYKCKLVSLSNSAVKKSKKEACILLALFVLFAATEPFW
jgi:hypothetical protein